MTLSAARPLRTTVASVALFGLLVPACQVADDNQSFRFNQTIERVDVQLDAGSVDFRPAEGDGASVDAETEWAGRAAPDLSVWAEDGTLFVRGECNSVRRCRTNLSIAVPADAEIDIDMAAGELELRDMSGPIWAELTAGELEGRGLRSETVQAEVVSGSIDLEFASGAMSVFADVTTGEIKLAVPDRPYQVEARVTTGDIDIDVSRSSSAEASIAAQVVTGKVRVRPLN